MERDIRVISEKVGTAVFTYDEIHNENVGNKYGYDYKRVIEEVSRLNGGKDMTQALINQGILKPLPGGEYKVVVGLSTEDGGGINYDGMAFFSSVKSDYETHYHELAHSLQKHYQLFNDKTMDEMYEKSEKRLSEEDKNKKLADREIYRRYLTEMHSEAFAYGAKMLRAENWWDFTKEAFLAYKTSIIRNVYAVKDKRKGYDAVNNNTSQKFYASYPIMKEVIKQVFHIRKQKRLGEYFDENGVINDEKLAKLSEAIILKKGYSPRTFNSFLNMDRADRHKITEHGWKRDSLKTLVIFLPLSVLKKKRERKFMVDHKEMTKKENQMIDDFLNTPISRDKNEKDQAIEAMEKILIKSGKISGITISGGFHGYLSDDYINNVKGIIESSGNGTKDFFEFVSYFKNINEQMKDNNYFYEILLNNEDISLIQKRIMVHKNPDSAEFNLIKEALDVKSRMSFDNIKKFIDIALENPDISSETKENFVGIIKQSLNEYRDKDNARADDDHYRFYNGNIFLGAIIGENLRKSLNISDEDKKKITEMIINTDDLYSGKVNNAFLDTINGGKASKYEIGAKDYQRLFDLETRSFMLRSSGSKVISAEFFWDDVMKTHDISIKSKEIVLDILIQCNDSMQSHDPTNNIYEYNALWGARLGEKLRNSQDISDEEKYKILEIGSSDNIIHKGFKSAFLGTINGESASKYEIDDKEREAISLTNEEKNEVSVIQNLVDNAIRSENFNERTNEEIKNIGRELDQAIISGQDMEGKTYSEAFMDKIITNKNISDDDKNRLLDMAIKSEDKEINQTEGGKRLYFDESKVEIFNQLNLSEEMKKELDFKIENGKFSIKIPENNELKKDVLNHIKVKQSVDRIVKNKGSETSKTESNGPISLTSNMVAFMVKNRSK